MSSLEKLHRATEGKNVVDVNLITLIFWKSDGIIALEKR